MFSVRVMRDSIAMDRWIGINVMGGSKAGYYAWRGRPESQRPAANRALPRNLPPPCGASRPVWRAKNPRGPTRRETYGEAWPRRTPYAPPRHEGSRAAAVPGV